MSGSHARLAPSDEAWPFCAGSPREQAVYEDSSSPASIDGTGSHLLLELCTSLDIIANASSWVGEVIGIDHHDNPEGWLVDQARADRVQVCIDYINRRRDELMVQYPGHFVAVESESKSDPGGMFGRDDWYGTCDITLTVYSEDDGVVFIEAIDYKDGKMYVNVTNKPQLVGYLGGKLRLYIASGPDLVRPFHPHRVHGSRMTIVQPKTHPPIRYQDISPADVVTELEKLSLAAQATDDPDAPLTPDADGKGHCKWCKHKPNCLAHVAQGVEGVKLMTNMTGGSSLLESIQAGQLNPAEMSGAELSQALDALAAIAALAKSIQEEAQSRAETTPGSVPGYGMVHGNNSYTWKDEPEIVEKMLKGMRLKKDQIYPAKLASTAQIKGLSCLTDRQRKKLEDEMIKTVPGKLKLGKVKAQQSQPVFDKPAAEMSAPASISFL